MFVFNMKLDGKIAVVTGGAMGNGLGIVKVFLKYGAKVIILDYSNQIDDTISTLNNSNVFGYRVDTRDKSRLLEISSEISSVTSISSPSKTASAFSSA